MTEADRIRDFFDHARWRPTPGREFLLRERRERLREIVSRLGMPIGQLNLCDVGCGGGADLAAWRDAGAAEVRLAGTELVAERVELARHALPAADIQAVDGFELPFSSGAFDVCTASLVLSTIRATSDRRRLLLEMRRVTRSGGLVVVYDFAVRKPWNREVVAISSRSLTDLWRRPNAVVRAAPFLPALDVALRLPERMGHRLTGLLPRTHRLWVWKVGTEADSTLRGR
jgi:SAM-dependent methyltransferase